MYKFILGILCLFIGQSLFSQNSSDVGVIVGVNYYMGDINPKKQLYSQVYQP